MTPMIGDMSHSRTNPVVLTAARESLLRRLGFDDFLARLSPKDRGNAEKRVSLLEEGPSHSARLWQRLACTMMTLAPHSAKFVGRQTVQFYIADGKYRMQVFALEDLQDGNMTVYCPDVLEEAVAAGLLARVGDAGDEQMYVTKVSREPLRIDLLNGSSLNPAAHFKDLVGWNRKAIRVTLPPAPSPAQVDATELLCAIAAQHFAPPAPASGRPQAVS